MSVREEFIRECINNREYLGFSYQDMSNCLIDMSEIDYKNFELGKFNISKENAARLINILCIKKPSFNGNNLEFDDNLTKEEREDLSRVASMIEGDLDD